MAGIKLEKRERTVLVWGTIALTVMAVYVVLDGPMSRYGNAKDDLEKSKLRLEKATAWHDDIVAERNKLAALTAQIQQRPRNFDLYTFISRTLHNANLSSRADFESQGRSSDTAQVDVTLHGVSMKELVRFFYDIYASNNLIVLYKLNHLKAARDGQGLECQVSFITPKA